jgi:rhodanese-related sulfurtransferase
VGDRIGAMGLLEQACANLDRLTPGQALQEQGAGAHLVDVRTAQQRATSAEVPGAIVIDLTILPWRLDPTFRWRITEATSWDLRWILICRHGYSSALAAWNLRQLGLHHATDVIGGFEGWAAAGRPTTHAPADERC